MDRWARAEKLWTNLSPERSCRIPGGSGSSSRSPVESPHSKCGSSSGGSAISDGCEKGLTARSS
eukprot:scaffold5981_cov27-Tisochrysis_lutea.AAC.1